MSNGKTSAKGVIMLLLTAFIWGSSFVAQSKGMELIEAFTFNGIRTLLGALVLLPVVLIADRIRTRKMTPEQKTEKKQSDKKAVRGGILIGVVLCIASNLQQFAFNYSTSGKIAFITAFYMLFVPLFGFFLGKRISPVVWGCVLLGCAGLYLLCITPGDRGEVNKGDILTLACAVMYAVHILLVEKIAPSVDGIKLSFVQYAVSGIISVILMFIFENPVMSEIKECAFPIAYAGIFSIAAAYTLQIIGQKYTESTVASLLLCMESVFGVLCGAVILHERLTGREITGCVIMFAAIIIAQVSPLIGKRCVQFKQKKT